jgi:hypothetical protein
MKKLILLLLSFIALNSFAQMVTEDTKRKFTFGLDVFTDIWQDTPAELDEKTINPGVNIFGSYNFMFGESNVSLSPGIGLGVHNMFTDTWLRVTSDSAFFEAIPETLSYKKYKMTNTYFDIPIELRYKSEGDFRIAVGFKFGFLMKAQSKYKGDNYIEETSDQVIIKTGKFNFIEKNRYGFTGRIGYKWLNIWAYYQLSTLFEEGKGPAMYPISIGITVIPF